MTEKELLEAQRIAKLIAGFISGTLTDTKTRELDEWIAESDENMLLFEKLTDENNIEWAMSWFKELDIQSALYEVEATITKNKQVNRKRLLLSLAAACIILIIGTIIFREFNLPVKSDPPVAVTIPSTAIHPGGKKAILLAGGKEFNLGKLQDQQIPVGTNNIDNSHYILSYANHHQNDTTTNILRIPAGGEYQVVLADGTRVWLNAASSLQYPVTFGGKNRKVELNGEAYFEVTHDPRKPFIVQFNGTEIAVKGTHFNVQAYADDASQIVSLLEGSVDIHRNGQSRSLAPDQEAVIADNAIRVEQANHIAESVAWTKGIFSFNKNTVSEVLQEVSRWYDIQVRYEGNFKKTFTGQIYRNSNLQQVLEMLESTADVQFIAKGNIIIVRPKP